MAITRIQNEVYANAAANNVTASYVSTPTAGNLLIAWSRGMAATDGGSIPGWTRAIHAQFGATANFVSILFKVAGAGESQSVTLTMPSSTSTSLVIEEWGGITSPMLDKTASTANTGSPVTSRSTGTTATTTINDELCVACVGVGDTITSPTWSNSYTAQFARPGVAINYFGATLIVSSTGAQETTATWTTSRLAAGCIATFGATPAAATAIPVLMNLYKQRKA